MHLDSTRVIRSPKARPDATLSSRRLFQGLLSTFLKTHRVSVPLLIMIFLLHLDFFRVV